nr:immunoglobulin heavy chain junction region [Macaca mulatta]
CTRRRGYLLLYFDYW